MRTILPSVSLGIGMKSRWEATKDGSHCGVPGSRWTFAKVKDTPSSCRADSACSSGLVPEDTVQLTVKCFREVWGSQ